MTNLKKMSFRELQIECDSAYKRMSAGKRYSMKQRMKLCASYHQYVDEIIRRDQIRPSAALDSVFSNWRPRPDISQPR